MVIPTTTITPEQKNELDIYYPNHRLSSCSIFFFYTYPVFSPVASLSTLTAARMYPRTTSMRPHMTTVRPMARVVATNAYVNAYKRRMEGSSFFSSPVPRGTAGLLPPPFSPYAPPTTINPLPRSSVRARGLFGLGGPELLVIGVVAAIAFGPSKLPELGKSLGKTVKSFQTAAEVRIIHMGR